MAANASLKITVPSKEFRYEQWTNLADVLDHFQVDGDAEAIVFEMVMRYCDAQDHAKTYRQNKAARDKEIKTRYEALVAAGKAEPIK